MGILTRTFSRAAGDLAHFFVILAVIVGGFAFMGHLLFGAYVDDFASFQTSILTCANVMIYGEMDPMEDALAIEGLRNVALLYHLAYSLLVVLVLVNIVLAIIVDSFEKANEARHKANSFHVDLYEGGAAILRRDVRGYSHARAAAATRTLLDAAEQRGTAVRGADLDADDADADAAVATLGAVDFREADLRRLLKDAAKTQAAPRRRCCAPRGGDIDGDRLARTVFRGRAALERIGDDVAPDDDLDVEDLVRNAEVRGAARSQGLADQLRSLDAAVARLGGRGANARGGGVDGIAGLTRLIADAEAAAPPDAAYVAELRAKRSALIAGVTS